MYINSSNAWWPSSPSSICYINQLVKMARNDTLSVIPWIWHWNICESVRSGWLYCIDLWRRRMMKKHHHQCRILARGTTAWPSSSSSSINCKRTLQYINSIWFDFKHDTTVILLWVYWIKFAAVSHSRLGQELGAWLPCFATLET